MSCHCISCKVANISQLEENCKIQCEESETIFKLQTTDGRFFERVEPKLICKTDICLVD